MGGEVCGFASSLSGIGQGVQEDRKKNDRMPEKAIRGEISLGLGNR